MSGTRPSQTGNRTDLSKRLREVVGLHAFAELFGFSWEDDSDWTWHDVACAMADAVDAATVGAVPETKYLMALDEAREAQRKLEMCQTIQRAYQSKCRSLKETNADLRRIIDDMKTATVGAGTCKNIGDSTFVCSECGAHVQITNVGRSYLDENGKRWYSTSNEHEFRHCPNCGARIIEEEDE